MSDNQASWVAASDGPANNKPQTSSLYKRLQSTFERFKERGDKTLFVFVSAWGELDFYGVAPQQYDWAEHDSIAVKRGGGFAIMAFDLRQSFQDQYPASKYGYFDDGPTSREGLNFFAMKPLINIADRNGVTVPATSERQAVHNILHGEKLSKVWEHPQPETLPRKKFIDHRPREHLALAPA